MWIEIKDYNNALTVVRALSLCIVTVGGSATNLNKRDLVTPDPSTFRILAPTDCARRFNAKLNRRASTTTTAMASTLRFIQHPSLLSPSVCAASIPSRVSRIRSCDDRPTVCINK